MKWFLTLITTILLSFNCSYADDDRHRFPMDLHDLKLTAQQQKAVEAAMKEYQYSYRSYHRQSEKTQKELNALFLNPAFDETVFSAKNLELERTSVEIRTQLFSRLHALLTPEQKRRFVRHIEEWDVE